MIPRYSQACIELVKESEGLQLACYEDAVGKTTIGWGHLCLPGEQFAKFNDRDAEELLVRDLDAHWQALDKLVRVDLSQGQVDALTDFVFNLGEHNFARSTLLRLVNQGDPAAADQFQRWCWAGAMKLPGLVVRRERERQLFLQADST